METSQFIFGLLPNELVFTHIAAHYPIEWIFVNICLTKIVTKIIFGDNQKNMSLMNMITDGIMFRRDNSRRLCFILKSLRAKKCGLDRDKCLTLAVNSNRPEIVRVLLSDPLTDPNVDGGYQNSDGTRRYCSHIYYAIRHKFNNVLIHFVNNSKIGTNPTVAWSRPLNTCAHYNNYYGFKIVLTDPRFCTFIDLTCTMSYAMIYGDGNRYIIDCINYLNDNNILKECIITHRRIDS